MFVNFPHTRSASQFQNWRFRKRCESSPVALVYVSGPPYPVWCQGGVGGFGEDWCFPDLSSYSAGSVRSPTACLRTASSGGLLTSPCALKERHEEERKSSTCTFYLLHNLENWHLLPGLFKNSKHNNKSPIRKFPFSLISFWSTAV